MCSQPPKPWIITGRPKGMSVRAGTAWAAAARVAVMRAIEAVRPSMIIWELYSGWGYGAEQDVAAKQAQQQCNFHGEKIFTHSHRPRWRCCRELKTLAAVVAKGQELGVHAVLRAISPFPPYFIAYSTASRYPLRTSVRPFSLTLHLNMAVSSRHAHTRTAWGGGERPAGGKRVPTLALGKTEVCMNAPQMRCFT